MFESAWVREAEAAEYQREAHKSFLKKLLKLLCKANHPDKHVKKAINLLEERL